MKKISVVLVLLLVFVSILSADEFKIPFSCYPKKLQEIYAQYGRKLDLSPNDRTEDSWGFVESRGDSYSIFTYRPATKEDMNVIMDIAQGRGYVKDDG